MSVTSLTGPYVAPEILLQPSVYRSQDIRPSQGLLFIAAVLLLILLVLTIFLVRSVSRHGEWWQVQLEIHRRIRQLPADLCARLFPHSAPSPPCFSGGDRILSDVCGFGYLFILAVYYTVKLM